MSNLRQKLIEAGTDALLDSDHGEWVPCLGLLSDPKKDAAVVLDAILGCLAENMDEWEIIAALNPGDRLGLIPYITNADRLAVLREGSNVDL